MFASKDRVFSEIEPTNKTVYLDAMGDIMENVVDE